MYLEKKQKKQIFILYDQYQYQKQGSRNYSTSNNDSEFSHLTKDGKLPTMVDVSDKNITKRIAHAQSIIEFPEHVFKKLVNIENNSNGEIISKKGPVFSTSIVAGTMAVKNTWNLIPFCHPIQIESCKIDIKILNDLNCVQVDCIVSCYGKTGVEMECLTGASVTSLSIYDMCKALSKDIIIKETKLISKIGGKSDSTIPPK